MGILKHVDRFSRSFIARLRALDEGATLEALGNDVDGSPLLSPGQRGGVAERRKNVLSIIDGKIEKRGENAVFFFR